MSGGGSGVGAEFVAGGDPDGNHRRPTIAVLDYGIGNLRSAQKALEKVGADARLTDSSSLIEEADGVVLPGVGAFGACMSALRQAGLDHQAERAVAGGRPFLGICVGMQMLFEESEESPGVAGLGLLPGRVVWLPDTVKRPQMQWNRLSCRTYPAESMAGRMLQGLDGSWMYFVHSLAAEASDRTAATVDYGGPVVAAVAADNIFAAQFHPEKSAEPGLRLLANFVDLCRHADASRGELDQSEGHAADLHPAS